MGPYCCSLVYSDIYSVRNQNGDVLLNESADYNYEKIILQTDDWRVPAIAVYFKLGFKPVLINKESEIRWNKIINNNFKNLKL